MLVERFRNKLQARGGRTLIGLARQFKIFDDNNSGTLDEYEFTKAIVDFRVDIERKDIQTLFKTFDYNNDGTIDFNEFIRVVVGPMNNFRTQIAIRAFKQIDYNGDGCLTLEDIKGKYNARMHPDVRSGKRTEDEVLTEFLETFEQHHNTIHGNKADGKVTPEEFLEYYSHVSSNIDNDAYFELMMSNAWNLESKNNPATMPFAGSKGKVINVISRESYRHDHHRNLFGTDQKTPFDKKKNTEWTTTTSTTLESGMQGEVRVSAGGGNMEWLQHADRNSGVDYNGIKHSNQQLVEMFGQKLSQLGPNTKSELQRVFKEMDTNKSNTLDIQEFWRSLCDYGVKASPEECRKLFDLFDLNGDGEIHYNELLHSLP